jgi:hypothetical protein
MRISEPSAQRTTHEANKSSAMLLANTVYDVLQSSRPNIYELLKKLKQNCLRRFPWLWVVVLWVELANKHNVTTLNANDYGTPAVPQFGSTP